MIILGIIITYLICWRWTLRRMIENEKRNYGNIDALDIGLMGIFALLVCSVHGPYSVVARRIERRKANGNDPEQTFVNLVEMLVGVDRPTRAERKSIRIKNLENENARLEKELGLLE